MTESSQLSYECEANKGATILGIDIGTSGIRFCIVQRTLTNKKNSKPSTNSTDKIIYESNAPIKPAISSHKAVVQSSTVWISVLDILFGKLSNQFDIKQIEHIVIDATSSTVLLTDSNGKPLTDAFMYNDNQSIEEAYEIKKITDRSHSFTGASGSSSTLAKALKLLKEHSDSPQSYVQPIICHQADLINHYLCNRINITDENNALKLGYDSINQAWSNWVLPLLQQVNPKVTLPEVVKPGSVIGKISSTLVSRFGFSPKTQVHAGTTDSIAGFLASGACNIGDSVSSLGSTLVIKTISDTPVFDTRFGLYSHRLMNYWLVGGASNSGGRVLADDYSTNQLTVLSQSIEDKTIEDYLKAEPDKYYPLLTKGERFPISNSELKPVMPNKPNCSLPAAKNLTPCFTKHQHYFLQLCHGLTQVEAMAYEKLMELGVKPISTIYTVGGGTQNTVWMQLRKNCLPMNFKKANNLDAAYGVTKLIP